MLLEAEIECNSQAVKDHIWADSEQYKNFLHIFWFNQAGRSTVSNHELNLFERSHK